MEEGGLRKARNRGSQSLEEDRGESVWFAEETEFICECAGSVQRWWSGLAGDGGRKMDAQLEPL